MESENEIQEQAIKEIIKQLEILDTYIKKNNNVIDERISVEWQKTYNKFIFKLKNYDKLDKKEVKLLLDRIHEYLVDIGSRLTSASSVSHFIISVLTIVTASMTIYFAFSRIDKNHKNKYHASGGGVSLAHRK